MNELLLSSITFPIVFFLIYVGSYTFHKHFSYQNKGAGIALITLLSVSIILIFTFFILITCDVFKYFLYPSSSHYKTSLITHTLFWLNVFIYILLPLMYFYFFSQENTSSENEASEETKTLMKDREKEEVESNDTENYNTNVDESDNNNAFIKNYFYYIAAYGCLNLFYLITYKIFYFDSKNSLVRHTVLNEDLQKSTIVTTDFEILTFINFAVFLCLGKFLALFYVPYGMAKLISIQIDNLKNPSHVKQEYNALTSNVSKNCETLKSITSQLMTGRPLTKKEKQLMKSCKENQMILDHKQEVLEDKYSKCEMVIMYITYPIKFLLIVISLFLTMILILSKLVVTYGQLFNSICGKDCGFIQNQLNFGFSLQNILYLILRQNRNIAGVDNVAFETKLELFFIFLMIFAYFISAIIISLKYLGIINLFTSQSFSISIIRAKNLLIFSLYSLLFTLCLVMSVDIFSLPPDFSNFFSNAPRCGLLQINKEVCSISLFGLFDLILSVNFSIFKYADIFFSSAFVFLSAGLVFYFPIKSLLNYQKLEEKKSRCECDVEK